MTKPSVQNASEQRSVTAKSGFDPEGFAVFYMLGEMPAICLSQPSNQSLSHCFDMKITPNCRKSSQNP